MTESELAFLALGLVLGAAGGAALIVVLGIRSPRREIRVTVTRDAVPRRSSTLAIDAFVTSPAEPAPGGPGDRRVFERHEPGAGGIGPWTPAEPGAGRPEAAPVTTRGGGSGGQVHRTIVPSGTPQPALARAPLPPGRAAVALRSDDGAAPDRVIGAPESRPGVPSPATGPAIRRILRGDHAAMLEVVDRLAASDGQGRREWEVLLTGLGLAIGETAIDEGFLEFPMGTPFWDAFTVEQCREIAASLASMGHRFDGHAGWADGRQPTYRELGQALADIGVDPVRVRAWPNSTEIAELLRGARPASDELVARDAPDLELEAVRELARWHAESLDGLWDAWDRVRPLLLAERDEGPPQA